MYTVSITADEADHETAAFATLHDALAYVDLFIRADDVWTIELWHGETCVYTFDADGNR
jgi:hypothetical protein